MPPRAANSHSASVGRRYPSAVRSHVTFSPRFTYPGRSPSRFDSRLQKSTASFQETLFTGNASPFGSPGFAPITAA